MKKKIYYKLTFTQKSPLRIGGSDSERTDSDLMLDGRGMPFVPGTSISGVLRSMLSDRDGDDIFGNISDSESTDSRIKVGDAVIVSPKPILITKRDGVQLGDWGSVQNKYDYEVVETDSPYVSIIEWSGDDAQYSNDIETIIDPLFKKLVHTGMCFGARTTRGFGSMDVSIKKRVFDFPKDLNTWIEFNPYLQQSDTNAFDTAEDIKGEDGGTSEWVSVSADISIYGNFSVSVPTSKVELAENGSSPDKIPLKNIYRKPVISGTAWAGTFRHHMNELCQQLGIDRQNVNTLFGIDDYKSYVYSKSKIRFDETQIDDGKEIVVTRNAVDRFTGGPKNTGLFTAELCYGGKGVLNISFAKDASKLQKQLIAMTIYDLQLGLVTVGGEAGVGRGIVHVDSFDVNGKNCLDRLNKALESNCETNVAELLEV